jgi:hypothetical protein
MVIPLLRLLEDWREALDKNVYVSAVLMDLSKAFDCEKNKYSNSCVVRNFFYERSKKP